MVTDLLALAYPNLKFDFAAIECLLESDRMRNKTSLLYIMMIIGALNWFLSDSVTARVVLQRKYRGKPNDFLSSIVKWQSPPRTNREADSIEQRSDTDRRLRQETKVLNRYFPTAHSALYLCILMINEYDTARPRLCF